jgi:hypothetical protein
MAGKPPRDLSAEPTVLVEDITAGKFDGLLWVTTGELIQINLLRHDRQLGPVMVRRRIEP